MASASEPAALMVKNAALKDAASRVAKSWDTPGG